ncbi:hypothetical protein J6590_049538 [Homalodisca vitripennis]|nr:hypothetical protein J6590_049538 [Homalodisca vitripennis]
MGDISIPALRKYPSEITSCGLSSGPPGHPLIETRLVFLQFRMPVESHYQQSDPQSHVKEFLEYDWETTQYKADLQTKWEVSVMDECGMSGQMHV